MPDPNSLVFAGRGGAPLQPQQFYVQEYVNKFPGPSGPGPTVIWRGPIIVTVYPRPKAGGEVTGTNLPLFFAPVSITLRAPVYVRPAPPLSKALVDDFVNLRPLYAVVVVPRIPRQDDWPNAATARPKITDTSLAAPAPLYTPNPSIPFNQDLWDSAIRAFPKVVGEPIGRLSPVLTPNPSVPFNQDLWDSAARIPVSLKSDTYFGAFSLYSPNPPIPFNQDLWENATRAFPKATGEPVSGVAPLLTPNPAQPFGPFDWFQIRSVQKAKVDDPYNATIIQPVVAVTFTIAQLDWPRAAPARPTIEAVSFAPPRPLFTPNPAQPFNQELWDSATRAFPKVTGEAFGTLNPVFTPNPTNPFNQYEWRSPARVPLSLKSDTYFGAFSLYSPNPPNPFNQSLWENAARAFPKATGEAVAGDAPLLTPNPAQPFSQADWYQIRSTQKAKVDDFVNLVPLQSVVVVVSFIINQNDWPSAKLPRPTLADTSFAGPAPLYTPNPARPFHQDIWDSATRSFPKAVGEAIAGDAPLLTPNPARPFQQSDWVSASIRVATAKVDDVVNLLTLRPIVVFNPFHQDDWVSATLARLKIEAVSFASPLTLVAPNPPRPFEQTDWPSTARAGPADRSFALGINLPIFFPGIPPTPGEQPGTGGPYAGRYVPWCRDIICRLEELKLERDRRRRRHELLILERVVKEKFEELPREARFELAPEIGAVVETFEAVAATISPNLEARIAQGFAYLAAEIDDEEAFLLLTQI